MAKNDAKVGPVKYLEQVRQEGRKVVWPTPREAVITTILVLIVTVLFGLFFWLVDWAAATGVTNLLKLGK
ncbi:MAG: preprotein translocase subunit SecE [Robiginitomaculum sp.]